MSFRSLGASFKCALQPYGLAGPDSKYVRGLHLGLLFLLLWPAILNGRPLYFSDTVSYLKGGNFAIEYAVQKVMPKSQNKTQNDVGVDTGENFNPKVEQQKTKATSVAGARSVIYSLYSSFLQAPNASLFLLVLANAFMASAIILIIVRLYGLSDNAKILAFFYGAIALFTSLPWFVSFAMPDVLAGFGILSMSLFVAFHNSLFKTEKLFLAAVVSFAVTSHASHIPLLMGLSIVGSLCLFMMRQKTQTTFRAYLWTISPVLIALMLTTIVNFVSFGETSVTAKRYPLTLARSIVDGPSKLHLENNCDKYNYAICDIYDVFPSSIEALLWQETGLRYKATPEQLDQIRIEEPTIVKRAMAEYPLLTITANAKNIVHQIMLVGLGDFVMGKEIVTPGNSDLTHGIQLVNNDANFSFHVPFFDRVQYLAAFACFVVLILLVLFRRNILHYTDLIMITMVTSGLLGNAAVCAIFSGVTERYQGRVMWVLPIVLLLIDTNYNRKKLQPSF